MSEISIIDDLLVYKAGYDPETVARIIKEKKLGGLLIFSVLKSERIESVDFLQDFNFLEKLSITSMSDYDFFFLKNLTNLKDLSINVQGTNEIDLSAQTNLEYLSINWRKKISGLNNCTSLHTLWLIEFKEKNLQKIEDLQSLINLNIKTASIESLKGIEKLTSLHSVLLGNCKKLLSIVDLNHLNKLQQLTLDGCPAIKDYDSLKELPGLNSLSLIDCGNIPSIKFIDRLPHLENLSLAGNTVVADGDLIPAKRIKNLEHKHYKHYNIKLENPEFDNLVKTNLKKIKGWFK
jgi:hypothetical protein